MTGDEWTEVSDDRIVRASRNPLHTYWKKNLHNYVVLLGANAGNILRIQNKKNYTFGLKM